MMTFQREIGRITLALLAGFLMVGLAAGYWALTAPEGLLRRGDNPRLVLQNQAVARGALLDRDGGVLAQSERIDGASMRALSPLVNPAIMGEVQGGFGVSGVEAMVDGLLRGEPADPGAEVVRDLLHQPRQGADVMLTLSPAVQSALLDALGERAGAALVLSVPGGEILGMVSQSPPPSAASAEATAEPAAPALNAALLGQYPAGGALLPGLLSAALLDEFDIARAAYPAGVCAVRLPDDLLLSLQEGFLYGCTAPFAAISAGMTPNALDALLTAFIPQPVNGRLGDYLAEQRAPEPELTALQNAQVSPLSMALMAAAIANDGAAPAPVLATSVRLPPAQAFTPLNNASPSIPVTTASNARRLQDLMRQAVAEGAAQNAGRARLDIGGLAALAGSDDQPVSWFIGFTSLPNGQGAAVAVALEGQRDPGLAADMGGAALEAAAGVIGGG
jgi:peptidoglycan glycosyltransferase